jgi:pimeloyl-ACP methyl ester carboxylesterase
MPHDTHETAPTQFAETGGGIRFAYRRFGRRGGTPLLLLNYFATNLDKWDPKVTNGFAAERDVILFDYPGIGGSSGETPSTVAALTKARVEFCRALALTRFDVLGFSLGGMIAQQLAADHPEMVRRIILSGTGPRGGEGMVFEDLSADELDDEAGLIMNAFFTQSEPSKAAGRAFIERTKFRVENRDAPGVEAGGPRRGGCYPRVGRDPPDGPLCDVGQNPPSDADCAWEQGRRHHADQCVPSR